MEGGNSDRKKGYGREERRELHTCKNELPRQSIQERQRMHVTHMHTPRGEKTCDLYVSYDIRQMCECRNFDTDNFCAISTETTYLCDVVCVKTHIGP